MCTAAAVRQLFAPLQRQSKHRLSSLVRRNPAQPGTRSGEAVTRQGLIPLF